MTKGSRAPVLPRLAGPLAAIAALCLSCGRAPDQPPPPPAPPEAPPASDILGGKPMYSQKNEELVIRDYFQDRRNGFFVDVGCWSPLAKSNTAYLELQLDWSGIGIDALPEYEAAWREKRPKSKFLNYLVSDHSDTVEPFYRSELPSVSSTAKENVERREKDGEQVGFEQIEVPTITLDQLLEQEGVSKIDLLSMDIEGAEPLALAGFDIERFRPELVCIEASPANRDALREYFESHGYERIDRYLEYDKTNYYYRPRASGPSGN